MGLARGWEVNLKWETRQLMATLVDGECVNCSPEFRLSDQSLIVAKKVGLSSKLAAGYLLRIRGTEIFQRSIQQFSVVQRLSSMRLAHRFAADQTFGGGDPTEWRLRYRLGTELPLNGQEADPKSIMSIWAAGKAVIPIWKSGSCPYWAICLPTKTNLNLAWITESTLFWQMRPGSVSGVFWRGIISGDLW